MATSRLPASVMTAFYADIQSIFDLLKLRNPGKDSQGGFNLHLMALEVPVAELGGDQQIAGVYATTSRRSVRVLDDKQAPKNNGPFRSGCTSGESSLQRRTRRDSR
jgi:hypothetical protein